ncbi:DUF3574 domain-containing protein [Streptomyces sp. NPDC045431]|uniref:DUF3574 domain-containing protein n=1 Tax=Streptomyces sp. NPDC045431 TaxID=3155613 RepID=UPI00340D5657
MLSGTTSRLLHLATAAVVVAGAADTVAGWAAPAQPAQQAAAPVLRGEPYVETHLFFGTGRHNGAPPITEEQFMKFLDDHITPRFPSGLTLQEGHGQWRDKTGSINSERSYELIVLYPRSAAQARDSDIEYIRDRYTRMWGLESVGRADVQVVADF